MTIRSLDMKIGLNFNQNTTSTKMNLISISLTIGQIALTILIWGKINNIILLCIKIIIPFCSERLCIGRLRVGRLLQSRSSRRTSRTRVVVSRRSSMYIHGELAPPTRSESFGVDSSSAMVVFPITEVIGASNDHTTPPYIAAPAGLPLL